MTSSNRPVATWLLCGCFLIFCMVVIGGITRLTGSGLSITEWKPVMGAIPPMNDSEWQDAFQKYKLIPQFQKINYNFNIDDFKSIFWWEFIHRLLGRFIGIVFIVPFLWFYFKRKFDSATLKKVLFLFLLGAFQGFIGWFMVKSGLTERTSVSHIRLAIHLIAAFITFGFTLYFALGLINENRISLHPAALRKLSSIILVTVIIQIIYGAFVAGMHAGKIYNTFPLMNGEFMPEGMLSLQPVWKNFSDNQVTVQFIHRMFAFVIVILSVLLFYKSRNEKINSLQNKGIIFFICAVFLQFLLGVFTLLSMVNIPLAVFHQAGAFVLFSSCVYLVFVFNNTRYS